VLFLAEAFTRPNVMNKLAKVGFHQSYTYFTWRNTKSELVEYVEQLTQTQAKDYFRPNFWPNTPDILPQILQFGGRPAFITRLILAATLSSNYGIYGPAFELMVSSAVEGKEEYLDSEKYEIKHWDRSSGRSLAPLIEWVNRIRRENPALQQTRNVRFLDITNDLLIAYVKHDDAAENVILTVVTLDLHNRQGGLVDLPLEDWNLPTDQPFVVNDLLSQDKYIWQGRRNFVELDPHVKPAHVFRIQRPMPRESDHDLFA
jgi:starch synthase (maltosyl-transferring)